MTHHKDLTVGERLVIKALRAQAPLTAQEIMGATRLKYRATLNRDLQFLRSTNDVLVTKDSGGVERFFIASA
jgi:hypothetical protein